MHERDINKEMHAMVTFRQFRLSVFSFIMTNTFKIDRVLVTQRVVRATVSENVNLEHYACA
ncbi:hypothetical protein MAR_023988 [Mya arenaria]|uniref:Uncharacterized protein n=1 Tax=Mya arenaria TaxID=6604 RepID=A0ABY7DSF8_MYAAR|nr:hypothetical protein MAR_023988 [Mya arenaria]